MAIDGTKSVQIHTCTYIHFNKQRFPSFTFILVQQQTNDCSNEYKCKNIIWNTNFSLILIPSLSIRNTHLFMFSFNILIIGLNIVNNYAGAAHKQACVMHAHDITSHFFSSSFICHPKNSTYFSFAYSCLHVTTRRIT